MWNRNFYGGHLVLCKLGVFSPDCLMGTSRFWKMRFIRSFWYHFGSALGGGGVWTWDPGGPPTSGTCERVNSVIHTFPISRFFFKFQVPFFLECIPFMVRAKFLLYFLKYFLLKLPFPLFSQTLDSSCYLFVKITIEFHVSYIVPDNFQILLSLLIISY